jgi:5,10-methylenetetrahydromethanopterin reductase
VSSIGVAFAGGRSDALLAFVERAEALGFDEAWIADDLGWRESLGSVADALAATDHLAIGLGPLHAGAHDPVTVATEIASLARLHPGRLTVAFGTHPGALGQGPLERDPVPEEVVTTVRMLLAGEVVNGCGSHVRIDHAALSFPPDEPPLIAISAADRRGVGVAARRADAVLFPAGTGPDLIEDALSALTGLRSPCDPVTVIAHVGLALNKDGARRAATALGGGNPAECAARVGQFLRAGVDRLILVAAGSEAAQYERFAGEVMPLVGRLHPEAAVRSARG